MVLANWNDLQALRAQGMRPRFPVVLYGEGERRLAWNLADCGFMVLPAEEAVPPLLVGLEVWLFTGCRKASELWNGWRHLGATPAVGRSWCERQQGFTVTPGGCCARR